MSEYLEEYDERAAEIQKTFSYDGYQIVRREMFAHLREPAVTIRYDSISFNTACIDGLEDTVFIQVLIHDDQKRLVIKRSTEDAKDSLRWCVAKPDKRKSRVIKGKFSKALYEQMGGMKNCRYKILGHKIQFEGETLYVFELEECEIFKERPKRTKAEREARAQSMSPEELKEADRQERKESMTPFEPANVEKTFGLPVEQHVDTPVLGNMASYSSVNVTAQPQQMTLFEGSSAPVTGIQSVMATGIAYANQQENTNQLPDNQESGGTL